MTEQQKWYCVELAVTGKLCKNVIAASEEEAKQKAIALANDRDAFDYESFQAAEDISSVAVVSVETGEPYVQMTLPAGVHSWSDLLSRSMEKFRETLPECHESDFFRKAVKR